MQAVCVAVSIPEATLYAGPVPQLIASQEEDAALVKRIAAAAPERDTAAEAEVCRRFASRVRVFGLRHLRNEAAASDLVQEVLIITLEKLRSGMVRDAERLAAFVLGTAHQCIVDSRRSTARRERILGTFQSTCRRSSTRGRNRSTRIACANACRAWLNATVQCC